MSKRARISVVSKSIEISGLKGNSAKESHMAYSYTLISEATAPSDMLVPNSQITQLHIPENNNIHSNDVLYCVFNIHNLCFSQHSILLFLSYVTMYCMFRPCVVISGQCRERSFHNQGHCTKKKIPEDHHKRSKHIWKTIKYCVD
jgi:hypothetical protein